MLEQTENLASAFLDWLLTSASRNELLADRGVIWHGRLMTATWLVVIPIAILIARFYKVTPRQDWPKVLDNPFWFVWHRRLGWLAMMLTVLAVAAVFRKDASISGAHVHHVAGWGVLVVSVFQVVGALFRGTHGGPVDPFTRAPRPPEQWPGDHYSMTRRRIVFEYSHKIAGYLALALTLIAIVTGLSTVDASRWMWIGFMLLCGLFAIAFLRLQSQDRCRDTYQAIWGVDPALPGNQRAKAVGFGVRRAIGARSECNGEDA